MKTELVALQPQLEQSKIDNTKMMKVKCIFHRLLAFLWSEVSMALNINTHIKYDLAPSR